MAVLLILLLPVAFGASYWLVGVVRRYALAAEVVDLPNERSLHQGRVARGGGLAIVILAVLAFGAAMFWWTGMALVGWPLLLVTLALAILGWIDDHYDLRVAVRILAQFLVAGAFVSRVGSVATFTVADGWIIHTGMLAMPLTVVWIVWMANLYNFMDGIDGLAGLQGMIGSVTLGLWFYWAGAPGLAGVCLVLCGACGGFLAWNWAPARVFMGDVGSVTLGGLFAALSVVAATRYDMPVIAFVILFIVFIGDATLTLVRRVMRREPFWQAHRSHYYQRAVQSGMSHSDVTKRMGGMAAISACLATLVVTGNAEPWSAMALALFLFAVVVFRVNRLEQSARVNQVK